MSGEHSSLSQTLTRIESEPILTRHIGRGIDRNGRAISEPVTFAMPPEMVHGIQFQCGDRPKPHLDVQGRRHRQTLFCGVRRATVFKQDDVPSAPTRSHHGEKVLMRNLIPLVRD